MLFTSYIFFIFFTVVFTVYFAIAQKHQWIWLLFASYFFYSFASPVFSVYLAVNTLITWASALWMGKVEKERSTYLKEHKETLERSEIKQYKAGTDKIKGRILTIPIVVMLGFLVWFKYFNFFMENLFSVFSFFFQVSRYESTQLLLPVGLSFYTFICIGYSIDVYRKVCEPQTNLFRFALFVSFFPQIMQGPIVRYENTAHQLYSGHAFNYEKARSGFVRIAWGLIEKMIIADGIAVVLSEAMGVTAGFTLFFCYALYALQIYADFKGYMDIALGAAQSLGIELEENFNLPYLSNSISEFWRRWHMTLGTWFRDYLFYPLLRSKRLSAWGKKHGKHSPTVFALLVVWTTTGLWHGAGWNYILWGLYHGIFIACALIFKPKYQKLVTALHIDTDHRGYRYFQVARTFIIVCLGYVFFRANNITEVLNTFLRMMHLSRSASVISYDFTFVVGKLNENAVIVFILLFLLFSYIENKKSDFRQILFAQKTWLRWTIYIGMVLVIMLLRIDGVNEADFIYFQF